MGIAGRILLAMRNSPLALIGGFLTAGAIAMLGISSTTKGYIAAGLFGFGVGGILTLLPIAWADYFGRAHFAAIRQRHRVVRIVLEAFVDLGQLVGKERIARQRERIL